MKSTKSITCVSTPKRMLATFSCVSALATCNIFAEPSVAVGKEKFKAQYGIITFFKGGKQTEVGSVAMTLEMTGGLYADVWQLNSVEMEKCVIDGKVFKVEAGSFIVGDFPLKLAGVRGRWDDYPNDGFKLEFTAQGVGKGAEDVDHLKGKARVLSGGVTKFTTIGNFVKRKNMSLIKDPALKAAGLKVKFFKRKPPFASPETGQEVRIGVIIYGDQNAFGHLEILGKDGKPMKPRVIDGLTRSLVCQKQRTSPASMEYYYEVTKREAAEAKLRIIFRDGVKEAEIPFEITKKTPIE